MSGATGCWHTKNEDGNEVCGPRPEPQPRPCKPPVKPGGAA